MHHLTKTLIELHERLEEAGKLLEKLAQEYADLIKENTELRHKLFWTETEDDGKC
jgi:regulator of replication initiation timing